MRSLGKSWAGTHLIKLKNDEVTIKGQECADGRKQQNWMSKEDIILPTVSTEGLMLTCMIDAMEGCDVATTDILEDFLQTDQDKGNIHIKTEGSTVTLL